MINIEYQSVEERFNRVRNTIEQSNMGWYDKIMRSRDIDALEDYVDSLETEIATLRDKNEEDEDN